MIFERFWRSYGFFDVKISFCIKFCFGYTLPEVCTIKNWRFFVAFWFVVRRLVKFWRLIDGPLKRPIDQTLRFRHGSAVTDSKKICGPSARKFFSRVFFSGSADPGSAVPLAKISAVGENLGRSRKSRPFAKISAVHENLGRSRKSRPVAKISAVRENLGRW